MPVFYELVSRQSLESIQNWAVDTLEDLLSLGGIIHQGPFPGVGLEVQT